MGSIWSQTVNLPKRAQLCGDAQADVAVIGAGMAGALIGYELTKRGLHTIVLEADRVGSGQTKNTTAKITAQHAMIYQTLIEQFGEEKARQYAMANQQAVERLRSIAQEGIDCDFINCPAYLYSRSEDSRLLREAQACQKLGLDACFTTKVTLPFGVKGAVRMENQGMFHPLKFIKGVTQDLELYERTPVMAVRGNQLVTERGVVTAQSIVFATHYPFINYPGLYFTRMHQERSYVVAAEGAVELDGVYYSVDPGGLSFRNWNRFLFVGGGNHRTGENSDGTQYQMLETRAQELWPGCRVTAHWSAQDCMSLDSVPYIGAFSRTKPHWYVATGFEKWGMTTSMVAAQLIADAICQVDNPLSAVFSPRRMNKTAVKNFMKEGGQAAKNLTKLSFAKADLALDELQPGQGAIVSWQGKKAGAYKNKEGHVYMVDPKCPHMGCQLAWNQTEKTWDCPCHGSRFDYEGNLIDNPAQEGL